MYRNIFREFSIMWQNCSSTVHIVNIIQYFLDSFSCERNIKFIHIVNQSLETL